MKKLVLFIFLITLIPFTSFSQEQISGKSKVQKFNIKPTYERGLPPNLFVELNFRDDNGNGIIESEENSLYEG